MTSSRSKAETSEDFESLPFAVVGMGASAGGIEALLSFFENAPVKREPRQLAVDEIRRTVE